MNQLLPNIQKLWHDASNRITGVIERIESNPPVRLTMEVIGATILTNAVLINGLGAAYGIFEIVHQPEKLVNWAMTALNMGCLVAATHETVHQVPKVTQGIKNEMANRKIRKLAESIFG